MDHMLATLPTENLFSVCSQKVTYVLIKLDSLFVPRGDISSEAFFNASHKCAIGTLHTVFSAKQKHLTYVHSD